MTRTEVLRKINEAKLAIQEYKKQGLDKSVATHEQRNIQEIMESSIQLIIEARLIAASGRTCSKCGGSGRA